MNMNLRVLCAIAIAIAIPLCAAASGPLDPGGPPSSTMRTLDQVRPGTPITTIPCILSEPGYYYVTGHLTCHSASQGIYVTATNVTIDLCGFTLDKAPPGSWPGIMAASSAAGLTIRNGALRGWGYGILIGNRSRVEDITVTGCDNGIWVGEEAQVANCRVFSTSNAIVGASSYGFQAGAASMVSDCIAVSNAGSGYVYGYYIGAGSLVTRCAASYIRGGIPSTTYAYYGADSTFFSQCVASESGIGLFGSTGSHMLNCAIRNCTTGGVSITRYSRAAGCAINNNGGDGLSGGAGNQVEDCVSGDNHGFGFVVNDRGSLRGCSARNNGLCGIRVSHDSFLLRNNCTYNGWGSVSGYNFGMFLQGYGSWAHANACVYNFAAGLEVNGSSNLVTASDCRYNSPEYSFTAGNQYGQILVTPGDGFRSGNPWANIQF